ncbi:MAG: hypothetical protein GYA60_09180 [Candidatus Methanofastidiosa archaeon]|nr:hypothetical protein [Candidatus Methanofastidiosa archaeon]
MGLMSWIDNKSRKLSAWDVAFVKIGAMIFGLIIGAYFPVLIKQYVLLLIVLFILFSAKPVYTAFK